MCIEALQLMTRTSYSHVPDLYIYCEVLMVAQLGCGSEKEFKAGFGSHTPMVLGQAKVVRYHPNAERYAGF